MVGIADDIGKAVVARHDDEAALVVGIEHIVRLLVGCRGTIGGHGGQAVHAHGTGGLVAAGHKGAGHLLGLRGGYRTGQQLAGHGY